MKLFIIGTLLTIAALVGCSDGYTHAESFATLTKIAGCWTDFDSSSNGLYMDPADIVTAQKHHDELVAFAKTLPRSGFRAAYENWAWYWQYQLDRSRSAPKDAFNEPPTETDIAFEQAKKLRPPDPCCKH